MKVCDRLKLYIDRSGLKQKAIAEKSGFSENQMSQMLNDKRSISADELEIICNAMGTSPNEIYSISPDEFVSSRKEVA
ncbi:helix-turn-helix transcriptional regulator [Holdemania sp. 1001302B_160321_E10]|uniref:helix-turn-helix domain-containing protein n=1 Tax=Holdemania sp. 1001302B_160321_E10 TaxID=2787120 RepID=UPI00189AB187|nr:helix-turn-helix transcriptional regulator [Holdemania sp. 1001302B_160321_E10]